MQWETVDFAPGAAILRYPSNKQRCLTFDWCCRLANWTEYTHRL